MSYIEELGIAAKAAERAICGISQQKKNEALEAIAAALTANTDEIIAENKKDLEAAEASGMSAATCPTVCTL